jgi:hypothetical protein
VTLYRQLAELLESLRLRGEIVGVSEYVEPAIAALKMHAEAAANCRTVATIALAAAEHVRLAEDKRRQINLSPETATAAVQRYGSQRAAARALGVSHQTVGRRLAGPVDQQPFPRRRLAAP